ncbi:hypothetical protein JTB14_008747 [Gonioctena quinquepunctata]|nr:hypothetical protein JTB14_008746 [Gonioctena quinquepunctata]KAG5875974.1 hypothetical protein JTB14_008747 [Gonioctena quinquepunctata]
MLYTLNEISHVRFEGDPRKRRSIGLCYNFQKFAHTAYTCKADPDCRHCAGKHKSRTHNNEDGGPNKCSNCSEPQKANFHGFPNFPKIERKEATKPLRPLRPPRDNFLTHSKFS